mgnify:FL=1
MSPKFSPMSARRRLALKSNYNITEDDYNTLLETQQFRCKICGKPWTFEQLCVDHSHVTGIVRGLLCGKCNSLLGFADDSTAILLKAFFYLKKSSTPPSDRSLLSLPPGAMS